MWWYYERMAEDDQQIRYAYARETKQTSGVIGFMKSTGEFVMLLPALMDSTQFDTRKALNHFGSVKNEGFPLHTMVATG